MKTGNIEFTYKSDLDKSCFRQDMDHGKIKGLSK